MAKSLFKKSDKSSIVNYRTVALLNKVSKIFEKCVFDALHPVIVSHLDAVPVGHIWKFDLEQYKQRDFGVKWNF